MTQISFIPLLGEENVEELKEQAEKIYEYAKRKRNWENAFQKWSNNHGIETDNTKDWGCCGYGSMCDWCEDNTYGRPCVRALNAMCREKGIAIDYSDKDFCKVWRGASDEAD